MCSWTEQWQAADTYRLQKSQSRVEQNLHIVSNHYLELISKMELIIFIFEILTDEQLSIWTASASNSEYRDCYTFLTVRPGASVCHFSLFSDFFLNCDFYMVWLRILLPLTELPYCFFLLYFLLKFSPTALTPGRTKLYLFHCSNQQTIQSQIQRCFSFALLHFNTIRILSVVLVTRTPLGLIFLLF